MTPEEMRDRFAGNEVQLREVGSFSLQGVTISEVPMATVHAALEIANMLGLVFVMHTRDGYGRIGAMAAIHDGLLNPVTGYEIESILAAGGWDRLVKKFKTGFEDDKRRRRLRVERSETRPWATMPVNSTFQIQVGPGQPKITTVRVACSVKGRKLGRKFLCHQYPDGRIEVWRKS